MLLAVIVLTINHLCKRQEIGNHTLLMNSIILFYTYQVMNLWTVIKDLADKQVFIVDEWFFCLLFHVNNFNLSEQSLMLFEVV